MKGRGLRRKLIIGVSAVVAVALLVLTVWITVAGPVAVFRILRYGDTDIDDFTHYPGRPLHPSDAPFQFRQAASPLIVPDAVAADLGVNPSLDSFLEANDTIAFAVVRDDAIRYERYFQGHAPSSPSQLFSVTKSVLSALIGLAIEDGYLDGVNQSIIDLVPELADQGFENVTLHHLLTMTSGSSYQENDNPFGEHVILNYTSNLESRILRFTTEAEPGEVFRYKSGDNALLGLALSRALQPETITRYAQRRLWTPLGMQDPGTWTVDHAGDGLEKTWCCLATSARDLAKFGHLFLHQGAWQGRQILPSAWVQQSTQQAHVPTDLWPSEYRAIGWRNYGHQWWLGAERTGDYFALGKDGQFLFIDPSRNLIVVRLGWSQGELRSSQWVKLFQSTSVAPR